MFFDINSSTPLIVSYLFRKTCIITKIPKELHNLICKYNYEDPNIFKFIKQCPINFKDYPSTNKYETIPLFPYLHEIPQYFTYYKISKFF